VSTPTMSKYGRSRSPSQGAMNAAAANTTARTPPPAATLAFATVSLHAGQMLRLLAAVTPPVEVPLHREANYRHHGANERGKFTGPQPEHKCARPASIRPDLAGCHANRVDVPYPMHSP